MFVRPFFTLFFLKFLNAEEIIWSPDGQRYDFIVVGAGASGAAVAARLAEDKHHYEILLLEAGGEPPKFNLVPYFGMGPFKGEYDWDFETETQDSACLALIDEKWSVPRGKALGGTTVINGMVYTRGNRKDYDYWNELGNDGWGFDDVLPYFKKLEDYQVPIPTEDSSFYGKGGPVGISVAKHKTSLRDHLFAAFKEIGHPFKDFNGPSQTGFFYNVATVRNGSRCSTYNAYLEPNKNRKNLHIITYAFVTKVKFDENKRASSVIFEKDGSTYIAQAQKEIILSAGSNNSPHILMLSGIGPKEQLNEFKIEVTVDLPGVGQNFQDHISVAGTIFTLNQSIGFNQFRDINLNTLHLWESKREGPLSVPIRSEAISFFNSKFIDPELDWPDYEIQFYQPPTFGFNMKKEYLPPFEIVGKEIIGGLPILLRPKSIGYMSLKSGDPHIPLAYQPKYLSANEDVEVLLEAMKKVFEIMKTKSFVQLGATWHGYTLPGCKHFEDLSDDYLRCYIRYYTFGIFHQSGTCKMGPENDKMAVVDSRLKVRGVKGLRVSDISISPQVTTGHTMAPSIMIGEKAAAMILEDWEDFHDEL